MKARDILNEFVEVEFVCVNDSFPDATKQEQQDELFDALREVPNIVVYKQDFGEHNSMAAIVFDDTDIFEIEDIAVENGVAVDEIQSVPRSRVDDIYDNRLEGLTDWYAS